MSGEPKELLYDNAPLVEVIAELRWQTIPLSSMPGASIDPFFEPTVVKLRELVASEGYPVLEELAPREVPREWLAGQPVFRFRKDHSSWPLYQLGPGIFTANIVPPYKGWSSFAPELKRGLSLFLKSYPSPSSMLQLTSATLRYIDAFTSAHGRKEHFEFLAAGMDIQVALPEQLAKLGIGSPTAASIELQMPAESPSNSTLRLKIDPGKKDTIEATIVDFALTAPGKEVPIDLEKLCEWFGTARETLSAVFKVMTTETVKKAMGPEREA